MYIRISVRKQSHQCEKQMEKNLGFFHFVWLIWIGRGSHAHAVSHIHLSIGEMKTKGGNLHADERIIIIAAE